MRHLRALLVPVVLVALAACDPGGGDSKAICDAESPCPAGWECVEGRCVRVGACAGAELCNGVDDDCDGETDPASCPWHFGVPMPVVELHTGEGDHLHPHASRDGLRLYYGAFDPSTGEATTVVATRTSREGRFLAPRAEGEPFRAPTVVAGLAPLGAPGAATFSADELEGFIQVREPDHDHHFDLAHRARETSDGVFTDVGLVQGASRAGVDEIQPFVSRDGQELFFSANPAPEVRYRLFRIARDGDGSFSGEATALVLNGAPASHADFSPFLADDGVTLFYESIRSEGEGPVLMRAVRAEGGDPNAFDVVGVLPGEATNAAITGEPFLSESTGELFFVSSRDGSPASIGIYRMRVCRDAPCPPEPPVACPEGAAATSQSPDARHCYGLLGAADAYDAARAACAAAGGALASVHSAAEASLLAALLGDEDVAWIGAADAGDDLFAWDSGEPFLFAPWARRSPTREAGCVALRLEGSAPRFEEASCAVALPALCETEAYPTW